MPPSPHALTHTNTHTHTHTYTQRKNNLLLLASFPHHCYIAITNVVTNHLRLNPVAFARPPPCTSLSLSLSVHLCRSSRQPQLVSRVRLSSSITRVRCWVRTSLRRCRCTTLDLIKAPPSPCCGATAPAKKWCKTPRFRFDCSESSLRTAMTGQCSLEPLSLSLSFSLSHALSLSLSLSLSLALPLPLSSSQLEQGLFFRGHTYRRYNSEIQGSLICTGIAAVVRTLLPSRYIKTNISMNMFSNIISCALHVFELKVMFARSDQFNGGVMGAS